jgi:hypothetical protein
MPEPDSDKRERSPLVVIVALVVAMLSAYPLSAGPVGWLIIRCGRPAWTQPYFESAYASVFWLQDHDPSRLLSWYLNLWWN